MSANTAPRRISSRLGEHLITMLVITIVVLAMLTAYPALAAKTKGTAEQAQQRVNMPLVATSQLDDQAAAPYSP